MKIIASAAVSLDGCLDDLSDRRLVLSTPEDWDAVHRLRASCDAILVGAGTLRADDPSLRIKDKYLRAERFEQGLPEDILRVTVSRTGELDTSLRFFTGDGRPVVFLDEKAGPQAEQRLSAVADVITGKNITTGFIIASLEVRGVRRLMVEGGSRMLEMFFNEGAVDEFRLAVAPFFVGQKDAPHLVAGKASSGNMHGMLLQNVENLGGMAVMHYLGRDRHYLREAIEESRKCAPSQTSYSVGAVILTADGNVYRGYTHETAADNHAEEEVIAKALAAGADFSGATIYSSMEPCSKRASKSVPCSELIIRHNFSRVVYALGEPDYFVRCKGDGMLRSHGIDVVRLPGMEKEVMEINNHIISKK